MVRVTARLDGKPAGSRERDITVTNGHVDDPRIGDG